MPALLGVSTFFLHQTSFCQLPGSGDAGQWTSGPAQASLGDQALLTIPANYKFAATPAAQAAAAAAKLGKLPGLLGFMTSESGDGWKVAFQFEKTGYVSAEAAPQFDKNAILKALRQNQAGSISWVLEPSYDAAAHRLQYAVSIQTADQKATEYVAQILGKEGVVRAIVLSRGVAAVDDFRQVTQVTFKPGMAYEDFRAGAQRAQLTLSQLPTLQPPSLAGSDLPAAPKSTLLARIGFGAGLLVVIACGVLILMRVWRKTTPAAQPMVPAASPAQTRPTLIAAATLAAAPAPPAPAAAPDLRATDHNTPLPAPAALRPKLGPTPMPNRNNNNRRPLRTFSSHFDRRRKEFDYNRYFADLMATVSGNAAAVQSAPAGYALKLTHLTNGAAAGGPPAFASANSELIANQTTLIEEQRRLIQEQTRLIEEKAKLIAEKNQLLKLQAQMLESKEL